MVPHQDYPASTIFAFSAKFEPKQALNMFPLFEVSIEVLIKGFSPIRGGAGHGARNYSWPQTDGTEDSLIKERGHWNHWAHILGSPL